jgi:hypothetical protein
MFGAAVRWRPGRRGWVTHSGCGRRRSPAWLRLGLVAGAPHGASRCGGSGRGVHLSALALGRGVIVYAGQGVELGPRGAAEPFAAVL